MDLKTYFIIVLIMQLLALIIIYIYHFLKDILLKKLFNHKLYLIL